MYTTTYGDSQEPAVPIQVGDLRDELQDLAERHESLKQSHNGFAVECARLVNGLAVECARLLADVELMKASVDQIRRQLASALELLDETRRQLRTVDETGSWPTTDELVRSINLVTDSTTTCPDCWGSGQLSVPEGPCPRCNATGRVPN